MSRMNPFADLSDFAPKAAAKPVEIAHIDQIAREQGFPSRKAEVPAVRRRYTTGRNQQLNIKVKAKTAEQLHRLADAQGVPLGEMLEIVLDAFEKATR